VPDDNWLTLGEEQLDRLADLLAIKLAATGPPRRQMLTVYDICATFQVSRAWVYENAGRLGGFKLGPGPRAPLRFDPKRVGAALTPLAESAQADAKLKNVGPADRRRRTHLHPVYDG
jgi:hypothetical protein